MSHYFINDASVQEKIHTIPYTFLERQYSFLCDNGLFSKEHIDYASSLLIQNISINQGRLLDLGCGYGAVGILLSGAYGCELTMADIHEKAVAFAKLNAERNHIAAECLVSDRFAQIKGSFDTIVLNPPIHAGKAVIYPMYEESMEHLRPGGKFYVVIQKKHGAKSSHAKLLEVCRDTSILYQKKGFYIFMCVKQ